MAAYFVVSYDIDNPEAYQAYIPPVIELLNKHNGEILVADYDATPIEGEKSHVYVVLRFETEEAAMGWYNDPAYGPVKQIRLDNTSNGIAVLTKQFVMPSE